MRIESYRLDVPDFVMEQIADIYIECFTGPPRFEKWDKTEVMAHLGKLLAGDADVYVVVEGDEEIVSFGIGVPMTGYFNANELIENGVHPESYYFAELATREAARGKGYGAALQLRREQSALERGHRVLSVRVRADNDITINLLKRNGFSKVGVYEGDIKGSHFERLLMEKSI